MLLNARLAGRAAVGAIGTGAVAGAMFFAAAPSALADLPPNCTAGDAAQVRANVSAGTSVYLFTHPWVNDFFTSLQGQPRDQIRTQVQDYLAANPREQSRNPGHPPALGRPAEPLRHRYQRPDALSGNAGQVSHSLRSGRSHGGSLIALTSKSPNAPTTVQSCDSA